MEKDSWPPAAEGFSRYLLTTGKSAETARTYVVSLRPFLMWTQAHETEPDGVARDAIEMYITEQLQSLARHTVSNRLLALRAYFGYLVAKGIRENDPTKGLTVKRGKVLPKRPVPIPEMRRLVYGCRSTRDQAIVLMLASTGIRVGELAKMKVENIDWQAGEVLIDGKGNKQRIVAPGVETMNLLRQVVGSRRRGPVWLTKDGDPLTRDRARKNFYRLAHRVNVDAHPHKLRATFASLFLQDGGALDALQSAMGHSDISTTAHYAAGTRQERGLRHMATMNLAERIL